MRHGRGVRSDSGWLACLLTFESAEISDNCAPILACTALYSVN